MNKNELFLSKIKEEQQKLKDNNYLGVIDERETRINALVKTLTNEEFDDEEMLRRRLEVKDKERIGWYEYGPGSKSHKNETS